MHVETSWLSVQFTLSLGHTMVPHVHMHCMPVGTLAHAKQGHTTRHPTRGDRSTAGPVTRGYRDGSYADAPQGHAGG